MDRVEERAKELYEIAEKHGMEGSFKWEDLTATFTYDKYMAMAKDCLVREAKANLCMANLCYRMTSAGIKATIEDLTQQLKSIEGGA